MKWNFLPCMVTLLVLMLGAPVTAADEFVALNATLNGRAVVMELPGGVRRVRLRIRQEDETWKLCTIAHLEGTERFLKLRLPDGVTGEDFEVAASYTDPFPFSYYQGQSTFGTTAADGATGGRNSPEAFTDAGLAPTGEPAIEESDIWKWRGSTLYFFNQYRGLQVIDVSDPAAPERIASHRLPWSGEQMYLHPSADLVILLTRDSTSGNGEVVLVRHESRHVLEEQEGFPVPGSILESRLVGDILYVVSRNSFEERTIDPITGVEHVAWRSGLAITKIDLGDPDNPVADPPLNLTSETFNYWGAQVQATPQALLVSTNAYNSTLRQTISTVHVVDISDPAATPAVTHQLPVAGQVRDKFNMQLKNGILTVVSQVWRGTTTRQPHASVETFDVSGPPGAGTGRLGHLEFAQNESITATRFVGDLCYVVTFLRIDPLFVVSLENPADPRLLGELEIPGFSTHLEPLGTDALISVGVEDRQIAVSWFDVSDPAHPALASRVYVGAPDGWSWTEANWDEKAFGFFPNEGLLLLPYQGSDPLHGWMSGVQVIELGDEELIKRGSFEHEFRARRAKVLGSAIASISGRSLRILDVSDLDNPQLLADLTLAWPADIVHRVSDWLVQLERGGGYWYWPGSTNPPARLHVSPVDDTDELTTSLDLGPGRVAGSLLRGDCLWIAQVIAGMVDDGKETIYTETFTVTSVDLTNPAAPVIAGRDSLTISADTYPYGIGTDYVGEILPDGSLVWYPGEQDYYFFLDPMMDGPVDSGFRGGGCMPWFPQSGRVYTVDIADKASPDVLAAIDLRESGRHWPEGSFRLVESTLYYGTQNTEEVRRPDGTTEWRAHHWLGQLDLANPAAPVKRELVRLPGTFEHALGTPSGGIVLFTATFESFYDAGTWVSVFRIQALAFDSINAFLLDELEVPYTGYGPKVLDDRFIVLARTDYADGLSTSTLGIYEWRSSGNFAAVQTLTRPGSVYRLSVSDRLLVAGESDALTFIDFVDPADPDPAVVSFPNTGFWQRLELIDIYRRETAYVPQGLQGVAALDFEGAFPIVLPGPANQEGPVGGPEWLAVELGMLPVTGADDSLLIGALPEGETWMAASSIVPIGYEDWMRDALGLAPGASVPAASEDSDSDGLTNGWEYHTGSNPGDPASAARMRSLVAVDDDGDRCFRAVIFVNPHAIGTMQPEMSSDAVDWAPNADIRITSIPFSSSVDLRIPADVRSRAFLRVTFFDN